MLITSTLVHTDLHHHTIAPLPFVYPHVDHLPDPCLLFKRHKHSPNDGKNPTNSTGTGKLNQSGTETATALRGFRHHYLILARFIFEGTEKNMMLARLPISHWFGRLGWTAAQGALIGIVFGLPLWCLAIVILGPIYQNDNIGGKWAPQVIKAVYAAILGWITNPVIATLALGSQAECHLMVIEHDEEKAGTRVGSGVEGERVVPTIHEDEEVDTTALSPRQTLSVIPSAIPAAAPTTPTTTIRSRVGSTSSRSSKPPLTTNVSNLSNVSPGMAIRPRGDSIAAMPTAPSRPRGMTNSSHISNGSFSYVLGGTGGRAQRPRASTRASTSGIVPPLVVAQTSETTRAGTVRERDDEGLTRTHDVFGPSETVRVAPSRKRASTSPVIPTEPAFSRPLGPQIETQGRD